MDGPARFVRSSRQRQGEPVRGSVSGAKSTPGPARSTRRGTQPRCSCDLLVRLADREPVREVLGRFSVTAAGLTATQDGLHRECGAECADWQLRLSQRGGAARGATAELEMLLAIVRTADTHAYQLLERAGVQCAAIRRTVIEELRTLGSSRLDAATRAPGEAPRRAASAPTRQRSRTARELRKPPPSPRARNTANKRVESATTETSQPLRRSTVPTTPRNAAASANETEPAPPRVAPAIQPSPAVESEPRPATTETTLTSIAPSSLPPLVGRDAELSRLADAIGRREARPPLLVGAPGSGRTLLACHLASMLSRPVFRLEATRYDDDSELRADLQSIAAADGVAVIDDLDRVVAEVAPTCLPALTHAWSVGSPAMVTIVSPAGRARLAHWLPGGTDSLDVVEIEPLRGDVLSEAVKSSAPALLAAHGVSLASDAKLSELVRLADRFLTGIAMPARALDLLDLACARTVREGGAAVRRATWVDIVVERSGLPATRIEGDDDHRLLELEARLHERVVGHDGAVQRLADLVRRNHAGFSSHRPIASVLLLGPSGVGKTEIAKALAEALFDRPDALVRLDMSEYAEPHAVARVIGAPPGYVGFEQGGALVDPLAARAHRIVLLDEIEKAHRDVHQLLLQVFDEGRLTDGRGRTVDFRHSVVIMTSNLGADQLASDPSTTDDDVLDAARAAFPVELWNRIEAPLVLGPLSTEALTKVCRRLVKDSSARLRSERGVAYSLSDDACATLVRRAGNDPSLGARPLRHLLTRDVESMLAEGVLRGRLRAGSTVVVESRGGRLTLKS